MKIKILFVAILLSMSTAIASSKLFKYIRNNNIDAIREYVIKNFDAIEEINEDGDSPLIYTVKQGKPYIAKALIDLGANVNFISENGETALSAAVKSEKPYYINLFIIHGAKIKMKNKKGQTLLMYAANMNQDTLAAHLLLEAGADINQKDVSGQTPIVYAAIGQNYSLFLYLMDQGANPEDKSFKGVKA